MCYCDEGNVSTASTDWLSRFNFVPLNVECCRIFGVVRGLSFHERWVCDMKGDRLDIPILLSVIVLFSIGVDI